MKIEQIRQNDINVVVIASEDKIITDVQSALDMAVSVIYETGVDRIIINKDNVTNDFFVLSTGVAGEVLQKFINYHIKIAIYGDYSGYTSKPLKDFIYESNNGKDAFFVATKEEAIRKLVENR